MSLFNLDGYSLYGQGGRDNVGNVTAGTAGVNALQGLQRGKDAGMNALLAAQGVNYRMSGEQAPNMVQQLSTQASLADRKADELKQKDALMGLFARRLGVLDDLKSNLGTAREISRQPFTESGLFRRR